MSDIKEAATVLTDEQIETVMNLAHSWALAAYHKALAMPFEDIDAIKGRMREALSGRAATSAPVAGVESLKRHSHTDGNWNVIEYYLAADVERLLAQAGATAEPSLAIDGWMVDGSLIYRLNDKGVNCDEINVTMVNGSRANDARHDAAVELLTELTSITQVPAAEVRAEDLKAIEDAVDVLDAFGNLPDGMMHPGPWNSRKAEDKIKAAREAISNLRSLAQQSTADKASEVRAAYERAAMVCQNMYEDGEGGAACSVAADRIRALAAPSTADSAGTGAMGEGAEA